MVELRLIKIDLWWLDSPVKLLASLESLSVFCCLRQSWLRSLHMPVASKAARPGSKLRCLPCQEVVQRVIQKSLHCPHLLHTPHPLPSGALVKAPPRHFSCMKVIISR